MNLSNKYFNCSTEKYGSVFKVQLLDDMIIFTSDPLTIKVWIKIKHKSIRKPVSVIFLKELLIVKNYPKSEGFSSLIAYPLKIRFLILILLVGFYFKILLIQFKAAREWIDYW